MISDSVATLLYYVSFKATIGRTTSERSSLVPMANPIEYGSDLELLCELLKEEFGATHITII